MVTLKEGEAEMLKLKEIGEIKITQGDYKDAILKALDDIGVKYCKVDSDLLLNICTIIVYDEDNE